MEEQSKLFKRKWAEFGRAILFWIVILAGTAYLFGFFQASKVVVKTDMEETIFAKGLPVFRTDHYDISGGQYLTDEEAFSGKSSVLLTPENAFGPGFTIERLKGNEWIEVQIWRKAKKGKSSDGQIVAQVLGGLWKACSEVVEEKDGWEKISCTVDPPFSNKGKALKIYCWNSGNSAIYFDDLEVKINYR